MTPDRSDWLPGHCLPQALYVGQEAFERDLTLLAGRWSFAGHASELAGAGDWVVAELGRESAIVVRGGDGVLRGFANVCRHRGSRICTAPAGRSPALICPYHAWSYALDGRLRHARQMPAGFDAAAHGLMALPVHELGGMAFVSFGGEPPDLADAAAALGTLARRFGWAQGRIAARRHYTVQANWKLALENYHECYHCGPAHPEFSALHRLSRADGRVLTDDDRQGWEATPDGSEVFRAMGSALTEGSLTGSRTGALLGPRMGIAEADGRCLFAELGFLSAFLAYADYGVIYRFVPRAPLQTEIEVIWLVHAQASMAVDELIWLWDRTSVADKTIIERNQAGVLSTAYRPGPFSMMETGTQQFVERYMGELTRAAHRAVSATAQPAPTRQ